ncbi:MerR family transcriptional regulator [Cellulomonas sp. NPDC058312]|uniref:MerR family transcriptional regulator n=1 Tax=Cellulomonas sp. NPDC058312 TaxID=3346441 RepID=UPI0036ECA3FF
MHISEDGDAHVADGTDGESGPMLTVAAVAGRLGVAPATLRTWDRRYGLGPSAHTAGAHRRYGATDVARLMTMRSLTLDGVPPADAARIARDSTPADAGGAADASPARHLSAVPDAESPAVASGTGTSGTGAAGAAHGADDPHPDGDLARIGVPQSTASAARPVDRRDRPATPTAVIDAALRADAREVARLLALAPDADLTRWWEDLVGPARAGIAARTVLAQPGDEPDALVVAAALAVLRERSGRVPRHPSRRRIVLLLAAPGEPRPLSLHVLAGALADAGVDARVVAGPTGRHRLLEIATMTTPSAVVLSSELPAPDLGLVAAVAEQQPDLPVFVMVPDEAAAAVPAGPQVQRVRTVPGLVHEVRAVCG